MSTNDEDEVTEAPAEEPSNTDLEQELRDAKAEAVDKPAAEEAAQEDKPAETVEAEGDKPEATLTTEKPSEPEKDLDWYKKAYDESTKEALRLKGELDAKPETPATPEAPAAPVLSATDLYVQQKQNEEIKTAFDAISAKYPDVLQTATYKEFTKTANILGRVTYESENRVPTPQELYEKTVVVMGLKADTSEQVASAVKDIGASTRTSSVPSTAPQSKVSEEVIALNQKMYPNKTRAEIIEELEPHIN